MEQSLCQLYFSKLTMATTKLHLTSSIFYFKNCWTWRNGLLTEGSEKGVLSINNCEVSIAKDVLQSLCELYFVILKTDIGMF